LPASIACDAQPGNYPIRNLSTHFVTSSDQAKLVIQPFHQHPARNSQLEVEIACGDDSTAVAAACGVSMGAVENFFE
jgi:hypothetical protein